MMLDGFLLGVGATLAIGGGMYALWKFFDRVDPPTKRPR